MRLILSFGQGTHDSIKNVDLFSIKDIGIKKIKDRHKFFIGKFFT